MSTTQLATERVRREAARARAGLRALVVSLLGPLTALAGLIWAIAQPYRVTILEPRGQPFWWLLVEPPLLVIAVGLLFHLFVARPLLDDLEREE
jgi:hypothetical protein